MATRQAALAITCASLALISSLGLRAAFVNQTTNSLASSPPRHRRRLQSWKFFASESDPRVTAPKTAGMGVPYKPIYQPDSVHALAADDSTNAAPQPAMEPLQICSRKAPISHETDVQITSKYYGRCPLLNKPPEKTTILLLSGVETFGRTGNNLIEFLHAMQYGKDHDVLVAVTGGSWAVQLITNMWMSIHHRDIYGWRGFVEQTFCIKILENITEAQQYQRVIDMETRDLFLYKHMGMLNQYIEFQGSVIRNLFRHYNDGTGVNIRQKTVKDMCSVIDAMFGNAKSSARYSVIHSRSLEGEPGLRLLGRIAQHSGCDPVAALDMEPEYVKAILQPLGMLEHPILFITDHQRPEILKKLQADPDIGPRIQLIPNEASWIGGDITVATMADVFIGNPASSFSGFIAKSRVALGYTNNYLFRKKNEDGVWVDVCDEKCIFDQRVMHAMS